MLKRITAYLITVILLSALLIHVYSAESVILPKGDANGDGKVTVADARIVLRMSMNCDNQPTVGSENFNRLKLSDGNKSKLSASDARIILRVAIGLDSYTSYYSKSELTDIYNHIANTVKNDNFRKTTKMSVYTLTKTSDTGKGSTGSNNSEFSATTDISISDDSYPLFGFDYVSAVDVNDLCKINIDLCCNKNLLSVFEDRKSEILWNGDCCNCIVIHTETKEEKLSEIKKKKANYIPSYKKVYNFNILPETEIEYEENDILTEEPKLTYTDISVNVSVDYICRYASAFSSLIPVAAIYNINTISDYKLSYYIAIPGQESVKQTEKGTATEIKTILYTFDRYI